MKKSNSSIKKVLPCRLLRPRGDQEVASLFVQIEGGGQKRVMDFKYSPLTLAMDDIVKRRTKLLKRFDEKGKKRGRKGALDRADFGAAMKRIFWSCINTFCEGVVDPNTIPLIQMNLLLKVLGDPDNKKIKMQVVPEAKQCLREAGSVIDKVKEITAFKKLKEVPDVSHLELACVRFA